MATVSVRRSRSGPQAQRNSTDVIVVRPTPASAAFVKRERFSFGRAAMHRGSGPVGIHLDNAEWEKKVMNSWPKKCTFVVREILQTERAYIASLEEIILGYMMPLHGYLLAQGEGPNFIHTVFGNINKLRQLHEELLAKLHAACGDPHEFADVFLETDFTHYREYCTQYTDANLFLQKSTNENEKLKLFITQCQHDLEQPLPLHSHLIKPVQRILKYQLMLQEMLKYIDEEDVIHPDVKEALDKMKKVAEEINTSFKEEREEEEVATPSTIARKRSKEIKSLQRSRSIQQRPMVPDLSSELLKSMEFEDSFTLLRANKNPARQTPARTVGSGRRQPRPALTHLIGMFESPKPAPGISSQTPAAPPPSPPPKPTAAGSPPCQKSLSPTPNSLSLRDRHLSSSSESWTSESSSGGGAFSSEEPSSQRKEPKRPRKMPLALRKSAPVVQRSRAEAQGEEGNRNSLRCESAHAQLVESQALLDIGSDRAPDTDAKPAASAEPAKPERKVSVSSIPRKPNPPLLVPTPGKAKKPLIPPKQVLLPNKPALLGHTAHKRPHLPHTTRNRRVVLPSRPPDKSLDDLEKFVIDMSGGEPVVSLPPVLQQAPPPSPPPTTFFPSMLKPTKNTAGDGVRSSVLARQEHMIEEMIRGGSRFRPSAGQTSQPAPESGAESNPGDHGRKVPMLPPTRTEDERIITSSQKPMPTSA